MINAPYIKPSTLANWTRTPMENKGWPEQVLIKVIRINKQCNICNNITNSEEKPKWHPMHSPYKVKTNNRKKCRKNCSIWTSPIPSHSEEPLGNRVRSFFYEPWSIIPCQNSKLKGQKLSLQCVGGQWLKLEFWTRCYSFIIIKYLHAYQKSSETIIFVISFYNKHTHKQTGKYFKINCQNQEKLHKHKNQLVCWQQCQKCIHKPKSNEATFATVITSSQETNLTSF